MKHPYGILICVSLLLGVVLFEMLPSYQISTAVEVTPPRRTAMKRVEPSQTDPALDRAMRETARNIVTQEVLEEATSAPREWMSLDAKEEIVMPHMQLGSGKFSLNDQAGEMKLATSQSEETTSIVVETLPASKPIKVMVDFYEINLLLEPNPLKAKK